MLTNSRNSGLSVHLNRLFRILFVLCFIQLCAYPALAQQGGEKNDDGMPSKDEKKAGELPKLALDAPDRLEYVVNLPTLSPAERQEIETPQSPSGPIKVGIHRAVPTKALGDLSPNLIWQPLADGNYGYIEVRSPEAKTVRLGLKLQLPKEARVQIYSVNSKDETLVEHNITQHELLKLGDEVYWTNHVEGEVIGIEIRIPLEENTQNVNVEIITLSHGFTSAAMDFEVPLVHIPCPAHVLAQCAIDSGEVLSGAVNATVMMFFDEGSSSYACSGTLIENSRNQPMVLTANHCISTNTVASTVSTFYFYQHSTCTGSSTHRSFSQFRGGAELLVTSGSDDATLLRLRHTPPNGVSYAGYLSRGSIPVGTGIVGVHHPDTTRKKFWAGVNAGNANFNVCDTNGSCRPVSNGLGIIIDQGHVRPGSSGSAAFIAGTDTIVGVVSAIEFDGCDTANIAWLGRFSNFYANGARAHLTGSSDDHGNTASTATTLSLNSNRTGSIETSGDKDVFAITLSQTGTLTVRTTGSTDTSGLLFDASQTFIQADGDSGSGSNFQIVEPSLAAGQYYLEVTAFQSATGPYTVHADFNGTSTPSPDPPDPGNDDHGSTIADATPIDIGQSESGVIEQSGDADVFSVQISQSGSLTTYSSGSTDTVGRLLNSDGTARAEDDDGGNGQNFRIQTNVDPGTYYVEVKGYGGTATGSYSIQTDFISTSTPPDPADPPDPSEDDHGDTIAAATPIEIDQSVSGVLEHSEDTDVFSLQIAQLGTLTAYTSSNIDTLGRLLDSDGLEVAQDDDGGQSFNFRIQTDVTPGTYYIEVRGYGGATGSYNIQTDFGGTSTPSDPPDPPESSDDDHGDTPTTATLIENVSETRGEIEVSGDLDYFEIEFPSIGEVLIYTTGSLDTVGELQDSSGSSIASNDDEGEGRNFRIQEDVEANIYYIEVKGYGSSTGTYTLHLEYNSHGLDPSSVVLAVSASSVDEHDRHRLTITATTSDAVIQDERLALQFSGTATQDVDYELNSSHLLIEEGGTQGAIELTPLRDWIQEPDETVTIEVAVEDSTRVPSATVTINDLFEGEGTTYQTVNYSDIAVLANFHEIDYALWVDATVYNLGSSSASPDNLLFTLYRGNILDESNVMVSSTVTLPLLDPLYGRYTTPFKIDLTDLDADTQYTGLVSVSELTDEPLTENNRTRLGFELDSEGNLVTMCSAPTLNTSSAEADPLSRFQWHLHENPTLLSTDWTIEENAHLHISDTLATRTTGEGVKIALLDTGVETCHPELREAISQQDATETNALFNSSTTGDHGTALAGLVVAEANNGIGGQGIAPGAEILGFNYLQNQTETQFAQGLGLADSVDPDLAIVSLGFSSLIPEFSDDSMPDLLATGTKLLRDGRGMVYVKASGDAFERCNRIGHPIHTELGCRSATTDPVANSPYIVVAGAFDSTAQRARYSSMGSNLWVVAPTGSEEEDRAGIVTTDQFGEPRGYASTLPDLLNSRPSDNPYFDHTSTFQGTGAATAMVVGGIALLLEEQPELTFREVKHVLANTARQLEPEIHPTRIVIDSTLVNMQDGWIENGAGYHFHNEYGFGAIDIDSAIEFATNFESGSLGLFAVSEWIEPITNENPQQIPDADGSGLVTTVEIETPITYENCDSDNAIPHCVEANAVVLGPNNESISLSEANVNIESLQVRVRLGHSRPADLGLRLTSPFGTSSIVNPVFNNGLADQTEDVVEYTFLTNAFYGENPVGEWTLEVVDVEQVNTGVLIDWYLKLYVGQHRSSTP